VPPAQHAAWTAARAGSYHTVKVTYLNGGLNVNCWQALSAG
jgi:hypothetical protein